MRTDKQADGQTNSHANGHTDRKTAMLTDKQTDVQTNSRTDRVEILLYRYECPKNKEYQVLGIYSCSLQDHTTSVGISYFCCLKIYENAML